MISRGNMTSEKYAVVKPLIKAVSQAFMGLLAGYVKDSGTALKAAGLKGEDDGVEGPLAALTECLARDLVIANALAAGWPTESLDDDPVVQSVANALAAGCQAMINESVNRFNDDMDEISGVDDDFDDDDDGDFDDDEDYDDANPNEPALAIDESRPVT